MLGLRNVQVKNVVRVNRILDGRFHAHPKYLLLLLLLKILPSVSMIPREEKIR